MKIDAVIRKALRSSPKTSCRWWHSWGRWEDVEKYQIVQGQDKRIVGTGVRQERRCIDCHILEMRKVENEIG